MLAFPQGSSLRVLTSVAILWTVYLITLGLAQFGIFAVLDLLGISFGSGNPSTSLPFLIFLLCFNVVAGLLSFGVFRFCLRWLKSEKAEAKAREILEGQV